MELPVDAREIYETADRNYLIFLAATIERIIALRSDAIRRAEQQSKS